MPIHARQGTTVSLQIGSGPQNLGLTEARPNSRLSISHFCLTTERFNVDRILKILADHGIMKSDPSIASGVFPVGARQVRVRFRHEDAGGDKEGTPELYLTDPDGIVLQLQDMSYCGGAGVLGNVCAATPEPPPKRGLIAARDLSHVTLSVTDQQRSVAFYRDLFGMPIQAQQGATPVLGVGSGPQFIMAGGSSRTPNIGHACLTMEDFNPDKVLKTLADFGIKASGSATGPPGPLLSYVTMRKEDRGGAKGGTPELYFTDPDGILMQIQDATYCGGSGYLGEVCG